MKNILGFSIIMAFVLTVVLVGCEVQPTKAAAPKDEVKRVQVKVKTNKRGLTVEQENIAKRLLEDNKIGSIKHLYVISAYSGQTLIYSTVKGKVTSSSKRLTPSSVAATDGQYVGRGHYGIRVAIGGTEHYTAEVLGDDGSYGSSVPYLFWFDSKGVYHQHYVSGGQILHISDQPLSVGKVTINMEASK